MSTAETKLKKCADLLTADELAELSAIDTDSSSTALSPGLREKLEQAANDLTEEERALVRASDDDVRGQMIKLPRVEGLPDSDNDGIPDGAGGGDPMQLVVRGMNWLGSNASRFANKIPKL